MAGLLDFLNSEEGRMGLGLLAAAGPRTDGMGFGGRVQEAMNGQDAWRKAQEEAKYRKMQMEEAQMTMAEKRAALEKDRQVRDLAMRFRTPAQQGLAPLQGDPQSGILPGAGRAASPAGFDTRGFVDALAEIDPLKAMALRKDLAKEGAEYSTTPQYDQQGHAFILAKDGSMKYLDGVKARDKLNEVRLGDKVGFRTDYSPELQGSLPIGQSPDSRASNAITMRGQNMTDARSRERLDLDRGALFADSGGPSQAGFVKQFGKPGAGYRWKADGSQEAIPGGPADQKAQMKLAGEGTVDSVVAGLRDKYNQLNTGGGIVNDADGFLGNIGARLASTGVGQTVGGAVGTKNQTSRDDIAMSRPLLLQSIMKATGMSAKQMDSNAELKLYLATATDPTKGYQANMAALDRIEELYGSGQGGGNPAAPQAPAGKKTATLADIQETARRSGKSTAEVTQAMRAAGYEIRGQ